MGSMKRQVSFKEVVVLHEFDAEEGKGDDSEITPENAFQMFLLSLEKCPDYLELLVDAKRLRDFGPSEQ